MKLIELKPLIITDCKNNLQEKYHTLKHIISEINESAESESKSTAGDKHETGRAMVQIEQEKLNKQLLAIEQQLIEFNAINFDKQCFVASTGSLIETDKGVFFIATAIGKLIIQSTPVFVISLQSPLGNAFKGASQNDIISFSNTSYKILSIL